jgi:hypothetical protein
MRQRPQLVTIVSRFVLMLKTPVILKAIQLRILSQSILTMKGRSVYLRTMMKGHIFLKFRRKSLIMRKSLINLMKSLKELKMNQMKKNRGMLAFKSKESQEVTFQENL